MRFSVNVWGGLFEEQTNFYEITLTINKYIEFLKEKLQKVLKNFELQIRLNIIYQLDGVPAYYRRDMTTF